MPSVAGISGDNASVFALSPTTEEYVREYFEEIPILADIAWCESRYRQFTPGGDIFRGEVNKEDVGVMQINEHYHLKTAENLDLNLYTLDGNLAYAKYLYEKEGTAPWVHSKKCWGKSEHIASN
ncbi:MAG TPA: hypothetical protein VJH21_02385 [Candidatus Paceibacterota bacterium]